MSVRLITDAGGVGYASVRLRGHVEPAALRVRVELGGRSLTLRPWLPPGWLPGRAPRPQPTMFAWPAAGLLTLVYLVGIYAIVYGVITCVIAFRVHSLPERMAGTLMPPAGAAPSH
jgi:Short repeat of unknown function (DUF308)